MALHKSKAKTSDMSTLHMNHTKKHALNSVKFAMRKQPEHEHRPLKFKLKTRKWELSLFIIQSKELARFSYLRWVRERREPCTHKAHTFWGCWRFKQISMFRFRWEKISCFSSSPFGLLAKQFNNDKILHKIVLRKRRTRFLGS